MKWGAVFCTNQFGAKLTTAAAAALSNVTTPHRDTHRGGEGKGKGGEYRAANKWLDGYANKQKW